MNEELYTIELTIKQVEYLEELVHEKISNGGCPAVMQYCINLWDKLSGWRLEHMKKGGTDE